LTLNSMMFAILFKVDFIVVIGFEFPS